MGLSTGCVFPSMAIIWSADASRQLGSSDCVSEGQCSRYLRIRVWQEPFPPSCHCCPLQVDRQSKWHRGGRGRIESRRDICMLQIIVMGGRKWKGTGGIGFEVGDLSQPCRKSGLPMGQEASRSAKSAPPACQPSSSLALRISTLSR